MNAISIFDNFCAAVPGINFEATKKERNNVEFNATVTASKFFDDSIYVFGSIYDSGSMHLFFTFDVIEPTTEAFELINNFNCNSSWLKAYIEEIKGNLYLKVHFPVVSSSTEDDAASTLAYGLSMILDDSTIELLKPLTDLTVAG